MGFDLSQFNHHLRLKYVYENVLKEEDTGKRKALSRYVNMVNYYFKLADSVKGSVKAKEHYFLLVKEMLKKKLGDIRVLDKKEMDALKSYLMGRWREYLGYSISTVKKGKEKDVLEKEYLANGEVDKKTLIWDGYKICERNEATLPEVANRK